MFGMGVLMAISTAASVYGQISAAQQQQQMADYNAKVAQQQAEAEAQAIERQAERERDANASNLSTLRNDLATRNIDLSTGSPLLAMSKMYSSSMEDANERARQAEISRRSGANSSAFNTWRGQLASDAGYVQGGVSLVKGAADIYDKYSDKAPKKTAGSSLLT